ARSGCADDRLHGQHGRYRAAGRLLRRRGTRPARRRRTDRGPARDLRARPPSDAEGRMRVLALDIGGTWLRADVDGTTVQRQTPDNGSDALAAAIELVGDAAVDAVGVSFGGRVRGDDVVSLHVPGWENAGLAATLRDRYGAPVRMANDANAGALAEWDAAGRPNEPCAYITVSTGVGGGIVVGGEILEGA